ncbi:MAG: glycosyltransferase family 1 protein [Deltaproteobacteria bacterium]|nr:glycosyltransferase family 1 protein [Candidatus Anaeroferrophillacea bacterium]
MKIALVTDAWQPQINGVVTTWTHVREELGQLGHELVPIHPGLFRTVPCPGYPHIRLAVRPGAGVRRRLEELAPDAVHVATEGPVGIAGRGWCRRHGVPFTTSYHTQFPAYLHRYARIPQGLTYRFLRWFHGPAAHILVPTASIARELEAERFARLAVWTRGVDTELFRPRETRPYNVRRPVFLYCGRVAREKNIESFLNLDLPGSRVVIGDGPAREELEKRFPDVVWCGFRTGRELAEHIAAGDVFVFPSRTDTFGVVMLEAMACGLPVAAFPVAGPVDVVRPGVSGFLDEDLAAAAVACLELDAEACRAQAREFTWRRVAELFLAHVVRRPPAAAAQDVAGGMPGAAVPAGSGTAKSGGGF